MVGHLAGVDGGGFGEDGIEAKWRKPLIGAVFVRSGEKVLLGYGEVSCGVRGFGAEVRGAVESSRAANAMGKRSDFGNEINDLTRGVKEAGMKLILGSGCRAEVIQLSGQHEGFP